MSPLALVLAVGSIVGDGAVIHIFIGRVRLSSAPSAPAVDAIRGGTSSATMAVQSTRAITLGVAVVTPPLLPNILVTSGIVKHGLIQTIRFYGEF